MNGDALTPPNGSITQESTWNRAVRNAQAYPADRRCPREWQDDLRA
jgi:hypothetical protein